MEPAVDVYSMKFVMKYINIIYMMKCEMFIVGARDGRCRG